MPQEPKSCSDRAHEPQLLRPVCRQPVLCNKRSHRRERPMHHNQGQLPLAATRESPRTATKTHYSQKWIIFLKKHNHLNRRRSGSDKTQHPFIIKTLQKVGIQGMYLNINGHIWQNYEHCTQRWKAKAFPLRSGTRKGCLLSPLLFNMVLEVIATAIRKNIYKRTPNWKRNSKTANVYRWHDTIHRKS